MSVPSNQSNGDSAQQGMAPGKQRYEYAHNFYLVPRWYSKQSVLLHRCENERRQAGFASGRLPQRKWQVCVVWWLGSA